MTQISVGGAGVDFGATTLFRDITFTVSSGERWGVVGRNGTGKTTLFRLLTGDLQPSHGTVTRQYGLSISLLGQHRDYGAAATVWEARSEERRVGRDWGARPGRASSMQNARCYGPLR